MKINELKVTDLMVGNWVICYHPSRPQSFERVSVGLLHTLEQQKYGHIKEDSPLFRIVQPIPLAPEILEKNGFEGVKEGRFPSLRNCYNDIIFQLEGIKEEGNCKILYIFKNIAILYVHELQHALKLCRIDKEIII